MALIGLLMALIGAAAAAPWVYRAAPRAAAWLLAGAPAGVALWLSTRVRSVGAGEAPTFSMPWVPELGLSVSLRLDGLALIFGLLIAVIGAAVVVYTGGYMRGREGGGRLTALLLAFATAMLGLVLADDILLLYVFWELTSITSWLLIGFEHEKAEAREAAWQALMVTVAGGLALLAAAILLGDVAGTFQLSAILERGDAIRAHPAYAAILILVLLGALTKSAQFPFHFWLPNAMAAPTPVSAYLHSATMVTAGVYLLARLHPALGETALWTGLVTGFGAATLLTGALQAVVQTDLKRLLAYTTISKLGAMVLLLGLGGEHGVVAAISLLVAHAFYKGALFLVVGALDHEAGGRDVTRLRGLARAMPLTAIAALLAALSMIGLPPAFGFVAEEELLGAVWEARSAGGGAWALVGAVGLGTALYATAGLVVGWSPFVGRAVEAPETPHEAPLTMWVAALALALAGLGLGFATSWSGEWLVGPAASSVLRADVQPHLELWGGVEPSFVFGVAAIAVGVLVYLVVARLREAASRGAWAARFGPDRVYGAAKSGLTQLAQWQTRTLQHGYLPRYMLVTVVTVLALLALSLTRAGLPQLDRPRTEVGPADVLVVIVILVATAWALVARSRISAVLAMSVVGYGLTVVFALFSAPDLAITQFLVETLYLVLIVIALPRLPRIERPSSRLARGRDGVVAAAAGLAVAVAVFTVTQVPLDRIVPAAYARLGVPEAHGRNLVNVILVDFRALDTLGEVTVLATAAVGVVMLLRLLPREAQEARP